MQTEMGFSLYADESLGNMEEAYEAGKVTLEQNRDAYEQGKAMLEENKDAYEQGKAALAAAEAMA